MRKYKPRPASGTQLDVARTTSPAPTCGKRLTMSKTQATVTSPDNHTAVLRACEGKNAAHTDPRNGSSTIRVSAIKSSVRPRNLSHVSCLKDIGFRRVAGNGCLLVLLSR